MKEEEEGRRRERRREEEEEGKKRDQEIKRKQEAGDGQARLTRMINGWRKRQSKEMDVNGGGGEGGRANR